MSLLILSCSDEKSDEKQNNKTTSGTLEETFGDGSVPKSRLIYTVLYEPDKFTVKEMDGMYRKDILNTAPDYDANLKNMWFLVLNERLANETNKNLKIFYLNEQIGMDQNLANIEGFYKLLQSCSSFMDVEQIFDIAAVFQKKNKNVIENVIQWKDAKSKEIKLEGLTYEGVKFQRSMATKR